MDSGCSFPDVPSLTGGLGTCFYCLVPPRWGVGGLAGIAPVRTNAEMLLFGLIFYFMLPLHFCSGKHIAPDMSSLMLLTLSLL